MATNETKTCEPCIKKGLTVSATKYCTDCDEAQCSTCTEVHNTFKAFENHHVISLKICISLKVDRNCSDHAGMLLDFFCIAHDRICCRQCIASDHRSCDQLLPIEVASKNVRKSVLFDNVRGDMHDITTLFTDAIKIRTRNRTIIQDMKQNIQREIDRFTEKAISKLNEMARKIRTETESVFQKLLEDEDYENIENEKKITENIKDQLALIAEHGSDIQLFSFLCQTASSLTSSAQTLEDIISTQKCPEVIFEAADPFSGVSSMGKIKVVDREISTALNPLRLKSAQDLIINRKSPTKLKLESKLILQPGFYTGICVLKDGRLVLSYSGGTYLSLIRADGQSEDGKIKLGGYPWGVAVHPKTDCVYVTLPKIKKVQVVNVKSNAISKISVPGAVYGIALINDKMALGAVGKVYITSLRGTTLASIAVGSKALCSITLIKSSLCRSNKFELSICETDNDKIHLVSINNETHNPKEMSIKHAIDLRRPNDSVCGLGDDMFVVCWETNKLIYIEKDHVKNEVVLEKGVLQYPFGLAFSNDYSKLHIINVSPAELLVFSCS